MNIKFIIKNFFNRFSKDNRKKRNLLRRVKFRGSNLFIGKNFKVNNPQFLVLEDNVYINENVTLTISEDCKNGGGYFHT